MLLHQSISCRNLLAFLTTRPETVVKILDELGHSRFHLRCFFIRTFAQNLPLLYNRSASRMVWSTISEAASVDKCRSKRPWWKLSDNHLSRAFCFFRPETFSWPSCSLDLGRWFPLLRPSVEICELFCSPIAKPSLKTMRGQSGCSSFKPHQVFEVNISVNLDTVL